jgi:hypothetical protein
MPLKEACQKVHVPSFKYFLIVPVHSVTGAYIYMNVMTKRETEKKTTHAAKHSLHHLIRKKRHTSP